MFVFELAKVFAIEYLTPSLLSTEIKANRHLLKVVPVGVAYTVLADTLVCIIELIELFDLYKERKGEKKAMSFLPQSNIFLSHG